MFQCRVCFRMPGNVTRTVTRELTTSWNAVKQRRCQITYMYTVAREIIILRGPFPRKLSRNNVPKWFWLERKQPRPFVFFRSEHHFSWLRIHPSKKWNIPKINNFFHSTRKINVNWAPKTQNRPFYLQNSVGNTYLGNQLWVCAQHENQHIHLNTHGDFYFLFTHTLWNTLRKKWNCRMFQRFGIKEFWSKFQ